MPPRRRAPVVKPKPRAPAVPKAKAKRPVPPKPTKVNKASPSVSGTRASAQHKLDDSKVWRDMMEKGKELQALTESVADKSVPKGSLHHRALDKYLEWDEPETRFLRASPGMTMEDVFRALAPEKTTVDFKVPTDRTKECIFIGTASETLHRRGEQAILSFCLPLEPDSECRFTLCYDTAMVSAQIKVYALKKKPCPDPAYAVLVKKFGKEQTDYVTNNLKITPIMSEERMQLFLLYGEVLDEYDINVSTLMSRREMSLIATLALPAIRTILSKVPGSGVVQRFYNASPQWLKTILDAPSKLMDYVLHHPWITLGLTIAAKVLRLFLCVYFSPQGTIDDAIDMLAKVRETVESSLMGVILDLVILLLRCTTLDVACLYDVVPKALKGVKWASKALIDLLIHILKSVLGMLIGEGAAEYAVEAGRCLKNPKACLMGWWSDRASKSQGLKVQELLEKELANSGSVVYSWMTYAVMYAVLNLLPASALEKIMVAIAAATGMEGQYTKLRKTLTLSQETTVMDMLLTLMKHKHRLERDARVLYELVREMFLFVKDILYRTLVCRIVKWSGWGPKRSCGCTDALIAEFNSWVTAKRKEEEEDKRKKLAASQPRPRLRGGRPSDNSTNNGVLANVWSGVRRLTGFYACDPRLKKVVLRNVAYHMLPSGRMVPVHLYRWRYRALRKYGLLLPANTVPYFFGVSAKDLQKELPRSVRVFKGVLLVSRASLPSSLHDTLVRMNNPLCAHLTSGSGSCYFKK